MADSDGASHLTDIDHVSVEDARERVRKTGLPEPSIIVNSGNGAHLYWLLSEPYLVDDAGDPPPVETEWVAQPSGKKKPRKYIVEDGERVYLDTQRHVSRLSDKARHCQDVLSGIAKAVGGDHTTDLSRLLRIPGSLNRKDQRNGRAPVATELVECDGERRYSFGLFEALKIRSPDTKRLNQIAKMPLPAKRKASPTSADKLAQLIAASSIAPEGHRSEADFAVCCHAIRSGISSDELLTQVSGVGKFAEAGERYFDVTWSKAELEVRTEVFEKVSKALPDQKSRLDADAGMPPFATDSESAFLDQATITVDPTTTTVADTLRETTNHLLATKTCYCRAEQPVVIRDELIQAHSHLTRTRRTAERARRVLLCE